MEVSNAIVTSCSAGPISMMSVINMQPDPVSRDYITPSAGALPQPWRRAANVYVSVPSEPTVLTSVSEGIENNALVGSAATCRAPEDTLICSNEDTTSGPAAANGAAVRRTTVIYGHLPASVRPARFVETRWGPPALCPLGF